MYLQLIYKGDHFRLNVVNNLTDPSETLTTSIVRPLEMYSVLLALIMRSIGTDFSPTVKRGPTELPWSPIVPLFLATTSCTSSMCRPKLVSAPCQYDFCCSLLRGDPGTYWYHSHISTQYCDGLRGPLIIYDPNDPHRHLYDVDDGKHYFVLLGALGIDLSYEQSLRLLLLRSITIIPFPQLLAFPCKSASC